MGSQGWTKGHAAERIEDLAWLDAAGESGEGAAARLGIDYRNLDKWARRNDAERWARMRYRNPEPVIGHPSRDTRAS